MSVIIGRNVQGKVVSPTALSLLLFDGSPRGQGVIKAEHITIKRTVDGKCRFPHYWYSTDHSEGVNYTTTSLCTPVLLHS